MSFNLKVTEKKNKSKKIILIKLAINFNLKKIIMINLDFLELNLIIFFFRNIKYKSMIYIYIILEYKIKYI